MRPEPIDRAIKACGRVAALAAQLDIKPQGISQWRRIPAERVLEIERITGIPRHELRPDIYPPPFDDGVLPVENAPKPKPLLPAMANADDQVAA